jgi:hypothetical protein
MNAKIQAFLITAAAAGLGFLVVTAIKDHMAKSATTSLAATK